MSRERARSSAQPIRRKMVALLRTTATLARCSIQLPSQAPRQCAAQESRLKPRLGPAAEAATARPFTGAVPTGRQDTLPFATKNVGTARAVAEPRVHSRTSGTIAGFPARFG